MNTARDSSRTQDAGPAPAPHRSVALVVEDDDAVREEVADLLREDGHDVLEAKEGGRALGVLRQGIPVDVILLDLWMPGMDGWSFRAEQRADDRLRHIPVVVLTADDSPQARSIDADAIIRKPFEGNLLCSTVRQVIAERRTESGGSTRLLADTVSLLASAVGHEVANPLMALIGSLEQARAAGSLPGNGNGDGSVDEMLLQCWRIAEALRTLRELPYPHWTREGDVDIAQILRAAVARTATEGLRIAVAPDVASSIIVRGDPLVVLYVCTAVLRNAAEAIPTRNRPQAVSDVDPPDVDVRLQLVAGEVVLDVRDRGSAIAEEDLTHVFTVDYAGRERAWGTGLRLWFVRQAVEALGGSVVVSNEPDVGVRCQVRLPAVRGKTQHV